MVYNVMLASNIILRGAGMGVSVLKMLASAPSSAVVARVAPASSSVQTSWTGMEDITLDGNKAAWGNNSNQKNYGYYLGQGTQGLISNCWMERTEIRNCLTYAFDVENVTNVSLVDCWAHDNGYTSGTGTQHNCDGFTAIGDDILMINCKSWSNAGRGFQLGQNGFTWNRCEINGCEAWNNGKAGASLGSDSSGFFYGGKVIGGSYFSNGTATNSPGIQLITNAINCTIVGATIYNNSQNGIRLSACSYCTVSGCTIRNNASSGSSNPEIYILTSATHNAITGNIINSTTATNAISEQDSSSDFNVISSNNIRSISTTIVPNGANTIVANNNGFNKGSIDKSAVTTKGDILAATGSAAIARLGVGSNGQVLVADSAQTAGVKWSAASDTLITIAASDTPSTINTAADYTCTGTGDEVTINTAIATLTNGGTVVLLPGTFTIANSIVFTAAKQRLMGSGLGATTIQGNGTSVGTFVKPNAAGLSQLFLSDLKDNIYRSHHRHRF